MATHNLITADSNEPGVLVSQHIAATETTQYTCPSDSAATIRTATLCNTHTSAITVSVSLVKFGGTAGVANRVLHSYSLAAGDSIRLDELTGAMLGQGDFISAIASTASKVALVVTGAVSS
jgi:hypothetical protein